LTAICGAAETAVAERLTTAGAAPLLAWTVSVPVTAPAAVGVTPTVKLPDCPAAIVIGNVTPIRLNAGLELTAWAIVTDVVPVFVTAMV